MKPYWKPYGGPGYPVLERAEAALDRYAMLRRGETVVVGVSGGPDSVCLLDVLARLGQKLNLTLLVAHADHGLSEAASEVAAKVARTAAEEGYEVHVARAPDLEGSNLQAKARDFRYEFLQIVAEKEGAERIATGHTLDDRVETTLARLMHGAGTSGLAGLPPVEDKRIRPLITSRRAETRNYCVERELEFFDDPANQDLRFERTAVRTKLLSAIEAHWGEGAIRSIARSSERLREDADSLADLAERLYPEIVSETEQGMQLGLEALVSLPRALRRLLLERAVGRVRDRSGGIDAVLDALDSPREKAKELRFAVASGLEIVLGDEQILVSKLDYTERDPGG